MRLPYRQWLSTTYLRQSTPALVAAMNLNPPMKGGPVLPAVPRMATMVLVKEHETEQTAGAEPRKALLKVLWP